VRRCRLACLWLAPSAAPSALPRTSLATGPPRPDLRISSSAFALRRCPRISLQLAPSASPLALPRIRTSTCVEPNSSGLAYDFSSSARSPAAVAAGLAPNPPGLAFRTSPCGRPSGFAFRLSLRSRLAPFASAQPSGRLPACDQLRLAPSSPAAFQPALWPTLSGVRLSPRAPICSQPSGNAIQLEPLTPGPDLAARVSRLRPAFGVVSPAGAVDYNPSASVPRLVPILPAPALRPAPLVSVNSSGLDPRALDPPGLRPS